MLKQTQRRRSLHIGKKHDQYLLLPLEGTILNSHRVIGIAINTSMVLNFALVTGCSLTSYPGHEPPPHFKYLEITLHRNSKYHCDYKSDPKLSIINSSYLSKNDE